MSGNTAIRSALRWCVRALAITLAVGFLPAALGACEPLRCLYGFLVPGLCPGGTGYDPCRGCVPMP